MLPPLTSLPAPVYAVGSPVPQGVVSLESGSTLNSASAMLLSASAAAVLSGAMGGVVFPLNTPPSKIPPVPARVHVLLTAPGDVRAPEFAQSYVPVPLDTRLPSSS